MQGEVASQDIFSRTNECIPENSFLSCFKSLDSPQFSNNLESLNVSTWPSGILMDNNMQPTEST